MLSIFSLFMPKSKRHKLELQRLYRENAELWLSRNSGDVTNIIQQCNESFCTSKNFKKFFNLSLKEGWDIYEVLRDEDFVLIAMYKKGISRSEAERTVKMFKEMTGL